MFAQLRMGRKNRAVLTKSMISWRISSNSYSRQGSEIITRWSNVVRNSPEIKSKLDSIVEAIGATSVFVLTMAIINNTQTNKTMSPSENF